LLLSCCFCLVAFLFSVLMMIIVKHWEISLTLYLTHVLIYTWIYELDAFEMALTQSTGHCNYAS
jgi:hypothetical protein